MIKKNCLTIVMLLFFIFSGNGYAAGIQPFFLDSLKAEPTASIVVVNGENVAFDAYNIDDSNYFKLRDLAYVLNLEEDSFEVSWDDENNAIILTSGQKYTVIGGEMEGQSGQECMPIPTSSKLIIDGEEVSLRAYNIDGNNYFKLRDIGAALEFFVDWDEENGMIIIDTVIDRYILPALGETDGLGEIKNVLLYENDILSERDNLDKKNNYKKIYKTDKNIRFINYEDGYFLDMPKDTEFDFSKSKVITTAGNKDFSVVISKEHAQGKDVHEYIERYFNRFILDEGYRLENNITLLENSSGERVEALTIRLNDFKTNEYDTYSYISIIADGDTFYRMMFKYNSKNPVMGNIISDCIESFVYFEGNKVYNYKFDYAPKIPANWTAETRALYNAICNAETPKWGIYATDIFTEGVNETIPALEEKLEHRFDIVLCYTHLQGIFWGFPTEFMKENYENGRIVELTYQITINNNESFYGKSPNLDIYKGERDDQIRNFAKAAKAFGKPFLFRLNNEMNSDWTNYSGVVNLSDPEIYISNWRRIYNIFKDEGVNNAIWIFNPNDHDYPPASWNDFLNYYPGDEYVQIFGVTGYNTGTYYAKENGEKWREFADIYWYINERCSDTFGNFPWMITEFASSSIGGDKVGWINGMFENLHIFPQIKAAVWFSSADFDMRPGKGGVPARPYYLDETEETLEAFRKGLAGR